VSLSGVELETGTVFSKSHAAAEAGVGEGATTGSVDGCGDCETKSSAATSAGGTFKQTRGRVACEAGSA